MTREDFKSKYLKDAFFWVDEDTHLMVQSILQQFGIRLHTGKGLINYHEGFNKILTFDTDKHHDYEYYQKVDMWLPFSRYGAPKNIPDMIRDYAELLKTNKYK